MNDKFILNFASCKKFWNEFCRVGIKMSYLLIDKFNPAFVPYDSFYIYFLRNDWKQSFFFYFGGEMRYIREEDFYEWLDRMAEEYRGNRIGECFESLRIEFMNGTIPEEYGIKMIKLDSLGG